MQNLIVAVRGIDYIATLAALKVTVGRGAGDVAQLRNLAVIKPQDRGPPLG
jgi:hypothetical protein